MRVLSLAVAPLVLALATIARADSETAAEKLFDEGRALLTAGRYAEACAKLEASEALAPAGGTELNLGDCWEHVGRTASAWGAFKKAAARARAANVPSAERIAESRAAALEPHLVRLSIRVEGDARIALDGAPLAHEAFGQPVPIDPGPHVVTAEATGRIPFRWSGVIDREDATVHVVLERERTSPTVVARPASPATTIGIVTSVVGGLAVGVGLGLGARAMTLNARAEDACPLPSRCGSLDAIADASSARDLALASTVTVVVGLATATAGVVVALTGPRRDATLYLAPRWGGAVVGGSF